MFTTGIKCPPPPPLPPNYVRREQILNEMVAKLHLSATNPNSYGTSLTVTGAGGFGKTSIVTALCHHPGIKEQFKDGVVFIELGPQATDPSMKLSQLYHLLTGQYLKPGDANHAEQEINQLTSHYCHNLLVIIDDVWHVEDAEPIVKAFRSCKIVLTTRMNDIEQYVPTKQVVSVGPMEQSEAISLLTSEVIDISQLSQEDVNLLDELAQDVHLWPLLLSLVRGHLSHNVKRLKLSGSEAILNIQGKLHGKGLTAFDKNNIKRSRKHAVKSCIDVTLELLSKDLSDKMKSLIIWTGIGTSMQIEILHVLWNNNDVEARDCANELWAYGLVQFSSIRVPPHKEQHFVEVHAVISQYLNETLESSDIYRNSPLNVFGVGESITQGLTTELLKSYGLASSSSSAAEYLKNKKSDLENLLIPFYIKWINMWTMLDPHLTILILQHLQSDLTNLQVFLPSVNKQIDTLTQNCRQVLRDVYRISRSLNQNVQRFLTERNYGALLQTIESFVREYPNGLITLQAVAMVKQEVIPFCTGGQIMQLIEYLQMLTPDYHYMTLMMLPLAKIYIKQLDEINHSLQQGDLETTYQYFRNWRFEDEWDVENDYLLKLLEVAPGWVERTAKHRGLAKI